MLHLDRVPTLMAAVGNTKIKEELKAGKKVGYKIFKANMDGYNFLPYPQPDSCFEAPAVQS